MEIGKSCETKANKHDCCVVSNFLFQICCGLVEVNNMRAGEMNIKYETYAEDYQALQPTR